MLLFWLSLAALAWTHVVYPAAVWAAARLGQRRVEKGDVEPTVTIVVAAYNEETVIVRRIQNLLELDYPRDKLELVVSSDASSDRTEEIALQYTEVTVIANPRGGKVAAQDRAVRQTTGEIVAFSDANCTWSADALRTLVRAFADPKVAYVCGQLKILAADGSNKEGLYWRYELAVRDAESRLSSVTGGNGSIYAVRRSDYVEVDPRFGHDLSLPYLMVQRGRRAVYESAAVAFEKPTPSNETEYRRKVRMFEHCWLILLRGRMFRRLGPVYGLEIVSHRLLRYASGCCTSSCSRPHSRSSLTAGCTTSSSVRNSGCSRLLSRGRNRAVLRAITWATLVSLWNYAAPRCAGELGGAGPVNSVLDMAIAGAGLVVTSPFLALGALAVKLQDGGPVLYRQTRVGRYGADFELLKLRTMIVGAEKQGAGFAIDKGDARITKVGRLLRRLSVDELPQLWNVVRGEMSVIGPRPTLRYQVEHYDERQMHRLDVKPGITGWAQIHGRASLPWAERIELDLWYVRHKDWKTDLLILLRTPLALFGGTYRGERGGWKR